MVSATFTAALMAQETGEAFLILVKIDHTSLSAPIRVTSDGVNTTSNGETFIAMPFELELPISDPDQPPRAKLTIDNVDRSIVTAIRSISTEATVDIDIVLASDPDTLEVSFTGFKLVNVSYDALTVEGDLSFENFFAEPYPSRVFSPADFPGGF